MNPHLNTSEDVFDCIKNHLKGFQFFDGDWYLPSSIPEKKLANAHKTIIKNFDKDEFPILYCDTTLMGGGDDSVVITNKRVRCKPFIGDEFSIYFEDKYEIGYYKEVEELVPHEWYDKLRNSTLLVIGTVGSKSSNLVKLSGHKIGFIAGGIMEGVLQVGSEFLMQENLAKSKNDKPLKKVKIKIYDTSIESEKTFGSSNVVIKSENNMYELDITNNKYPISNFLRAASATNFTLELENVFSYLTEEYKLFLRDNFNPRIKV
jgi:hypothetical protein